jgi:hypothetical protein
MTRRPSKLNIPAPKLSFGVLCESAKKLIQELRPAAHISLSLSASSPTFSISGANDATNPFHLIVKARIVSSSKPELAITLQTDSTPLDHGTGLANAFFRGGFSDFVDIADMTRSISLRKHVRVNYGSPRENDLRKIGFMGFETVPASEELAVKQPIKAEKMWDVYNYYGAYSLGPNDVKPGDKFQIRIKHDRDVQWWHFGSLDGDLKDKKFVGAWVEPQDVRKYLEHNDEERVDENEWVCTEKRENLKMTAEEENDSVVIEFVE